MQFTVGDFMNLSCSSLYYEFSFVLLLFGTSVVCDSVVEVWKHIWAITWVFSFFFLICKDVDIRICLISGP